MKSKIIVVLEAKQKKLKQKNRSVKPVTYYLRWKLY